MKLTKSQALLDGKRLLSGKWELDHKHAISYRSGRGKESVRVKGIIIDAKPSGLLVHVESRQNQGKSTSQSYHLKGHWGLNSKNRITFELLRGRGKTDTLTFKNAWKINQSQQFIYAYKERSLVRKKSIERTLTFKGYWEILDNKRLVYQLHRSSKSSFVVKGAFQSKSILAKKGEIRYQYGFEVRKGVRKKKTLTLFGKWKYSRKVGLKFEMKYDNRVMRSLAFGGEYHLNKKNTIGISLKTSKGKELGASLIWTRNLPKTNGNLFIELENKSQKLDVKTGLKFSF